MLHVFKLVEGEIYKLHGSIVKLVSIVSTYEEELFEEKITSAIVVYDSFKGFFSIRHAVRENGDTSFEELTSLEKELL